MKEIVKQLLKRGDFVQFVAEEIGNELVRNKIQDSWFPESCWNTEFFNTLRETINKRVLEEVNIYMEENNIKNLVEHTVRTYLVKSISDILERNND